MSSTDTAQTAATETTLTFPGTETQAPESTRAFHGSDYRRAARLIQGMRHVRGDRYAEKSPALAAKVDAVANMLAVVFEGDAQDGPGIPFSAEAFLAGTLLPAQPQYSPTGGMDDLDTLPETAQDVSELAADHMTAFAAGQAHSTNGPCPHC